MALQEELERYKKEVLEGLQIEEEGLTDLVRKKTKQTSNTRSYNDPVDGSAAYNIKDHVLKNSLNNLKTDPSDHGIQKRSDDVQTRHRKRHAGDHHQEKNTR